MGTGVRTRVKAPGAFTATSQSESVIKLSWTAKGGFSVSAYQLYRAVSGVYTLIYAGTDLSYTDRGLNSATLYLYQLKMVDAQSHSSPLISAAATTDTIPIGQTPTRRFSPGHYVAMLLTQTGGDVGGTFTGIPNCGTVNVVGSTYVPVANSGVRSNVGPVAADVAGIHSRHRWVSLNPTGTTYDLSPIALELAQLATFPVSATIPPLLLVIRIDIKTFGGTAANQNPMPADLANYAGTHTANGWLGYRWSPTVRARYNTLCQKIGAAFDGHPNFGGIATQETSISGLDTSGVSSTVYTVGAYTGQDAYTVAGFFVALADESNSISTSCPHARHFAYANFAPNASQSASVHPNEHDYLDGYGTTVSTNGGVYGGPDLVVGGAITTRSYPTYTKVHNGTSPITTVGATFCSVQPAEWQNESPANQPTCTLQDRFDMATSAPGTTYGPGSPLNLDIIIWDYHTTAQVTPYKFNSDATSIFHNNPQFGNYSPPVSGLANFIYMDLNAAVNGNGFSANSPKNVLPTSIADNTQLLFNSDNGIQVLPIRTDVVYVAGNNCVVSSYGSTKAVVSGFQTFTSGWTQVSGNIYKRTYAPAGTQVGAVINVADTTGSAQGTVLKFVDMSTPASFTPAALAANSYAFDWSTNTMYVNIGSSANSGTIGIASCGRFISVQSGASPTTVVVSNLRVIGLARQAFNIINGSNGWHVTGCETYAIGGYWTGGTTGNYEGAAFQISHTSHNHEIDNNLIEQTHQFAFSIQHFGGSTGGAINTLSIHHNTIRYWALAAIGISDFGTTNTMGAITIQYNIMTGGGGGFSGVSLSPTGVTDGVGFRGTALVATGMTIDNNTIDGFDGNVYVHQGTVTATVSNNRLSSAKYGIRNLVAASHITATSNTFCANTTNVSDVNQSPVTLLNGGLYSGNTSQATQCFTPDLATQGVQ